MISNTTNLVDPEVGQRRERPKASADCLLSLAAAPTFAIMALLAGVDGGRMSDMLCSAAHGASPLSGMVPMYLLMSVRRGRRALRSSLRQRRVDCRTRRRAQCAGRQSSRIDCRTLAILVAAGAYMNSSGVLPYAAPGVACSRGGHSVALNDVRADGRTVWLCRCGYAEVARAYNLPSWHFWT